jgi:hypothetical protein
VSLLPSGKHVHRVAKEVHRHGHSQAVTNPKHPNTSTEIKALRKQAGPQKSLEYISFPPP